jgi:hypothetical protein
VLYIFKISETSAQPCETQNFVSERGLKPTSMRSCGCKKLELLMEYYFFLVLQCSSSNKALLQIYNRKSKAFFLRGLRDLRFSEKSANFLNKTLWVGSLPYVRLWSALIV